MRRCFVLLLLSFLALSSAADDRLFTRPWVELEPLVRIEAEYPIPIEKAQLRLLEEARTLISGMVYGWAFVYTPSDRERHVEEVFVLTPVAEVPWGSPRLTARETEVVDTKLYARISYAMSPEEAARRESWASSAAPHSTGRGTGDLLAGPAGKSAALAAAIREAVRSYLTARVLNKPREIRGEVVLWDDPQTIVRPAGYITTARVKLRVSEIIPYRIF
jgi:hypothetical protein